MISSSPAIGVPESLYNTSSSTISFLIFSWGNGFLAADSTFKGILLKYSITSGKDAAHLRVLLELH